jgi:hypothetical protein
MSFFFVCYGRLCLTCAGAEDWHRIAAISASHRFGSVSWRSVSVGRWGPRRPAGIGKNFFVGFSGQSQPLGRCFSKGEAAKQIEGLLLSGLPHTQVLFLLSVARRSVGGSSGQSARSVGGVRRSVGPTATEPVGSAGRNTAKEPLNMFTVNTKLYNV